MKKQKINNFVRKINELKKENKLDLSIGEDLSIALMNLVSLEEHFMFSFMKTKQRKFLDFLRQIRELRKKLLARIVKKTKEDYSEKWCISKHLLATCMRLTEVGTKELYKGRKKQAEALFSEAFEIYSMFWAVNGVGDADDLGNLTSFINSTEIKNPKLSKLSNLIKKILDCCRE